MKTNARRDSLLTIIGLAALVVGFLFVVYFPGRQAAAKTRAEIQQSEQSIRDLPLRIAELESLKKEVSRRQEFLNRTESLLPSEVDLHELLGHVAKLAGETNLEVTQTKLLDPVEYVSYRAIPIQVGFRGRFSDVMRFIRGLEKQERLCTFEDLTIESEAARNTGDVEGRVYFSVYVRSTEKDDSSENSSSPGQSGVDTKIR
jgi:Tfp pilus assembly protein PilO